MHAHTHMLTYTRSLTFAHGHTDTWAHTQGAHTDTYSLESPTCAYALMHSGTHVLASQYAHAHAHILARPPAHFTMCSCALTDTCMLSNTCTLTWCATAPPRRHPGRAIPRPRSCFLLSSPDLVTTAWCEPRPQLCHPIALGYIRVLVLSPLGGKHRATQGGLEMLWISSCWVVGAARWAPEGLRGLW